MERPRPKQEDPQEAAVGHSADRRALGTAKAGTEDLGPGPFSDEPSAISNRSTIDASAKDSRERMHEVDCEKDEEIQQGSSGRESDSRTSRYRGVCWNKKNKRWQAAINNSGKYIYLGSFLSEEEAAQTFDRAALQIRGKQAKINFHLQDYENEQGDSEAAMKIAAKLRQGSHAQDEHFTAGDMGLPNPLKRTRSEDCRYFPGERPQTSCPDRNAGFIHPLTKTVSLASQVSSYSSRLEDVLEGMGVHQVDQVAVEARPQQVHCVTVPSANLGGGNEQGGNMILLPVQLDSEELKTFSDKFNGSLPGADVTQGQDGVCQDRQVYPVLCVQADSLNGFSQAPNVSVPPSVIPAPVCISQPECTPTVNYDANQHTYPAGYTTTLPPNLPHSVLAESLLSHLLTLPPGSANELLKAPLVQKFLTMMLSRKEGQACHVPIPVNPGPVAVSSGCVEQRPEKIPKVEDRSGCWETPSPPRNTKVHDGTDDTDNSSATEQKTGRCQPRVNPTDVISMNNAKLIAGRGGDLYGMIHKAGEEEGSWRSVLWDGRTLHSMGIFSTERDAHQACASAIRIISAQGNK